MAAVTGAEAPPVEDAGTGGADDTENGDKNVQEALAGKIAQLDAKKNEDKGTEKKLSRMYKKASKELKEQLEAITSDSEKVKFLQQMAKGDPPEPERRSPACVMGPRARLDARLRASCGDHRAAP